MAPEALPRLFDPFFSLKPDGTGLGLAIANRTVERAWGRITAAPGTQGGLISSWTALDSRINDEIGSIISGLKLHFVDNGDGTITDNETGLQWKKKVAGTSCLHCVNDVYTWSTGDLDPAPDGSAFTSFLGTLNECLEPTPGAGVMGGFGGHCDWRLPTIDELQTILVVPCSAAPCIDPTFGPTAAPGGPSGYWSATTSGDSLHLAWFEHFDTLDRANIDAKSSSQFVRAVRTAF